MGFDLQQAITYLAEHEGSDLHLRAGALPLVRLAGELQELPGSVVQPEEDLDQLLAEIVPRPELLEDLATRGEIDFALQTRSGRVRASAFKTRGRLALALRLIPERIRGIRELGLPEVISEIARAERGIILVCGTTGSGKSTTLAAIVDQINSERRAHIVSIEDPIEYLHTDHLSQINQREIGEDTASFSEGLRRVLRQDPDVILIGEMRDQESVRVALSAAETGHLVLSTLHTLDAGEAINRILDFFEEGAQSQARAMLASTLVAVVSQRLVKTQEGDRAVLCEVMRQSGRVHDAIADPEKTVKLPQIIAEGAYYGMQTFDQHLLDRVLAGEISKETALAVASSPHDFSLMLDSGGVRSSSASELFG